MRTIQELEEILLKLLRNAKRFVQSTNLRESVHWDILWKFISCINLTLRLRAARRHSRKCWVKSWRARRMQQGSFHQLARELREEDSASFLNYCRTSAADFDKILTYIKNDITKRDSSCRKAISPKEQLMVTLRYLATGESLKCLEYHSRLSHSYLVYCISRVCRAIWKNMRNKYMKFPDRQDEWLQISKKFESKWNFPLCLGALDGKHVAFYASKEDGAFYYNYKGTNSIVLLALADADCKFIYVDVGANGRSNDGGVLNHSSLQAVIDGGSRFLPKDKIIGSGRLLPYVFVADNAFALSKHVMKPYSYTTTDSRSKIFNNRLSRARQVVERAFGILSSRLQIILKPINLRNLEKIEDVVLACCVLHNFLLQSDQISSDATSNENYDYEIHTNSHPEEIRSGFKDYFCEEGMLPWINDL